jgi:hypothetical protein
VQTASGALKRTLRFSQRLSRDHLVLELDEDKHGLSDDADRAGAGGGVLESPPALGEQREAAFTEAAGGPEQGPGECADGPRL